MPDLLESAASRARELLRPGKRVLIAVSGGIDSMVLLRLLHQLAPAQRWKLSVAHLNHRLRGASSDADEQLVRTTAGTLSLPFISESADVKAFARAKKVSLEMAARVLRHEFLARTAARLRIPHIALAHHASDQLELFFLRLLRGSGSEGLGGMQWENPSPANRKISLVRPLLNVPKNLLYEFARHNRVRFRDDVTNSWLEIERNRIRHKLLPYLRQHFQPALDRTVVRTAELLRAEAEVLNEWAREWNRTQLRRSKSKMRGGVFPFARLHLALQRKSLQLQLLELGIEPDFQLIEDLRQHPGKPFAVAGPSAGNGAVLRQDSGQVKLGSFSPPANFNGTSLNINIGARSKKARFGPVLVQWKIRNASGNAIKPASNAERFDADKVGNRVILRHWRPGDRFRPIGLGFSVKLQDFFTNEKIPRDLRRQLLVATTAKDQIFWIEGARISERFKLTSETIRVLQWRWRRR